MNVLIVGKSSYIGCHVGNWLTNRDPDCQIRYLSVRDEGWKEMDLSGVDAVVFAAAIVHRKDIADPEEYDRVNARLPEEFARKAKAEGVKQFLLFSTAAVYGVGKGLPGNVIHKNTPLKPVSLYGSSKLKGEKLVQQLHDEKFTVSVVRPMNVYGKGCPGNYIGAYEKVTALLPVLPKAFESTKQGLVHIDNLCALCEWILRDRRGGVYHAQDPQPVSAWGMMDAMARAKGMRKKSVPCEAFLKLLRRFAPVVKLYGGVAYAEELVCRPAGGGLTSAEGLWETAKE